MSGGEVRNGRERKVARKREARRRKRCPVEVGAYLLIESLNHPEYSRLLKVEEISRLRRSWKMPFDWFVTGKVLAGDRRGNFYYLGLEAEDWRDSVLSEEEAMLQVLGWRV